MELSSSAGTAQGPYFLIAIALPFCCTVPYFLLVIVTGTVQSTVLAREKQRRGGVETSEARAGLWQRYAPLILGWILPQVSAVCLTAFLVPLVVSAEGDSSASRDVHLSEDARDYGMTFDLALRFRQFDWPWPSIARHGGGRGPRRA